MTIKQVKDFFLDKEQTPCPLTEKLVGAGYQQTSGGYIERAKKERVLVDYTKNSPSQYWHLMTYCDSRDENKTFGRSIVCGELIFWMTEVSESISTDKLEQLANDIIANPISKDGEKPIYDRVKWNKEIQKACFDCLEITVTRASIPQIEDE